LQSLVITLPYITLPGPVVDISGGNCSGLAISGVQAVDVGTPQQPEVSFQLSGVRLSCWLRVHESLNIHFGLVNSAINVTLAAALRQTSSPSLPLPLGPVSVTSCNVESHLEYLNFGGASPLQPMLQPIHNQIRYMIDKEASKFACGQLEKALSEQASLLTGYASDVLVPFVGAPTPSQLPTSVTPLADWSEYPPMQLMRQLIMERPWAAQELIALTSPLTVPVVDSLMHPVTETVTSSSGNVTTSWSLQSAVFRGLESLRSLSLDGSGPTIDVSASFEHMSLDIGVEVLVDSVEGQVRSSYPLQQRLNMTVTLQNASFNLRILAMLSDAALRALYVDQLQTPRCFAECALQATSPANASLGMWDWSLGMSPELHLELPGLPPDFAASFDTTVAALLRGHVPSLQALLRGWVQVARSQLDTLMWQGIATLPPCEPTGIYFGPGDVISNLLLWGSGALLFAGLATAVWPARSDTRKAGAERPLKLDPEAELEEYSLATHPLVHARVVRLFPIAAVAAIVLFLYSDVCIATCINFVFFAKGEELTVGPALAFSVVICAVNAWCARAYLIAFCIGVMSILWPFVKLFLLLWSWMASPKQLSLQARDSLLRFLDEYGKWSLIDTWLGILALACYKLGWHSKTTDAFFVVDPVPEMPFFTFVFASVLTLIVGHVASGYHRRVWESSSLVEDDAEGALRRPLRAYAPWCVGCLLVLALPITAVLIVQGAVMESFQMVESGALATLFLEPDERIMRYSLVELGVEMTRGRSSTIIGLFLVQFIFFLFSLAIPLALQVALLVFWLVPMTYSSQLLVLDICRALDAWAAYDVFALAVLVSHYEFGLFSTFLMHENNLHKGCNLVVQYLDTECFHMECVLTPGFAVLALAGALSYVVPKLALRASSAALEERAEQCATSDAETDRLTNDSCGCGGGGSSGTSNEDTSCRRGFQFADEEVA